MGKKKTVAKAFWIGKDLINPGSKIDLPAHHRVVILKAKIHKWDRWHYPDERICLPTKEAKRFVKNGYATWAKGVFKGEARTQKPKATKAKDGKGKAEPKKPKEPEQQQPEGKPEGSTDAEKAEE